MKNKFALWWLSFENFYFIFKKRKELLQEIFKRYHENKKRELEEIKERSILEFLNQRLISTVHGDS